MIKMFLTAMILRSLCTYTVMHVRQE